MPQLDLLSCHLSSLVLIPLVRQLLGSSLPLPTWNYSVMMRLRNVNDVIPKLTPLLDLSTVLFATATSLLD